MSKEENSVDTQGVKAWKVKYWDWPYINEINFGELAKAAGLDICWYRASAYPGGSRIEGTPYAGGDYEMWFTPTSVHFEYPDGTTHDFCIRDDVFALAITYGIYEEA